MTKYRFGTASVFLPLILLIGILGCSGPKVVPGMTELIDNFQDQTRRGTVLSKYSAPGIVPEELAVCESMSTPLITKTEEKEGTIYYTLESRVEKCEQSPAAVGTTRIFAIGWKNGKIEKFVWGGPKGGKVEY
jgi:hypothetical protein